MSGANVSPIGRNKEEWLVQATDYRKLNDPPRPRLQRNGTIYLMARPPLLCQGGDFAFPAGCPRRPCPADDLWVTLKHHRKEGWLRHQRKFGEATEADAAGVVFLLDSSENHPGFSSASTIRCAKPSMAASTKGRLSVAEQPKRQRVCVTFERPFLSSSAFMTGINSTAALSPMNSGSAIAGMSETSLKSTIMIPALTPRSA